jgi:hypothetical protein
MHYIGMRQEDEEEDVSSFWMTLGIEEDALI